MSTCRSGPLRRERFERYALCHAGENRRRASAFISSIDLERPGPLSTPSCQRRRSSSLLVSPLDAERAIPRLPRERRRSPTHIRHAGLRTRLRRQDHPAKIPLTFWGSLHVSFEIYLNQLPCSKVWLAQGACIRPVCRGNRQQKAFPRSKGIIAGRAA